MALHWTKSDQYNREYDFYATAKRILVCDVQCNAYTGLLGNKP
jgi:hypothetical protein